MNPFQLRFPAWIDVISRMSGQANQVAAVGIHQVDLIIPFTIRIEGDAFTIGGPGSPFI
jgi:hypothetical protein